MNLDSYRASQIGLVVASLLVLLLVGWFFFARVGLYEISQQISFDEQGRLMATFAPEAMDRIRQGQAAIVRYYRSGNQPPLTLRAMVFDAPPGENQVEILVQAEDQGNLPETGSEKGQVEVEVDRISPYALVMRATGKYVGGSSAPAAPTSQPTD